MRQTHSQMARGDCLRVRFTRRRMDKVEMDDPNGRYEGKDGAVTGICDYDVRVVVNTEVAI